LKEYYALLEKILDLKAENKVKDIELQKKVLAKYRTLTADEIQILVIDDKWIVTVADRIASEIDTISQSLTQRIAQFGDRYDRPIPVIQSQVDDYESKVQDHLKKM